MRRMVRAKIHGRERSVVPLENTGKPKAQLAKVFNAVFAASDAALVCHDNRLLAFSDKLGSALKRAGNEMEIFPPVDIGVVDIDDAVSIQKRGFYRAAEPGCEGKAKSHANFLRSSSM